MERVRKEVGTYVRNAETEISLCCLKIDLFRAEGDKKNQKKKKNLTNVEKEMYVISFSIIFE